MPYVTSAEMLQDAQKRGYAVGAFNCENMEMVKAIIAAAENLRAPVMLQTTPSTIRYGTLDTFAAIVKAEAKRAGVPVCLHLDHGSSFDLAVQAMQAGYSSVMIDGSKLPFEENIAETKRVADVARAAGIPARYVQGYCFFLNGGSTQVLSDYAHAWPEAYIEGLGWVPFEPTGAYKTAEDYTWKLGLNYVKKTDESDEKSKSISNKESVEEDAVNVVDAVGSLIISAISSNIERVCVLSLVLPISNSASVADIIARISSADKPT